MGDQPAGVAAQHVAAVGHQGLAQLGAGLALDRVDDDVHTPTAGQRQHGGDDVDLRVEVVDRPRRRAPSTNATFSGPPTMPITRAPVARHSWT